MSTKSGFSIYTMMGEKSSLSRCQNRSTDFQGLRTDWNIKSLVVAVSCIILVLLSEALQSKQNKTS